MLNMREVLIQLPTDDSYSGLSSAQEIQLNPQLLSRLTGTYSYDQVKLPFLLSKCASLASGTLHSIGSPGSNLSSGPLPSHTIRGKAMRQSKSQGIRTDYNSGIRNCALSTWLASYTNSVNLSHHFLLVLHCIFQVDSINHVIWACNPFCSMTSGMACLVVYLEATVISRQLPTRHVNTVRDFEDFWSSHFI